MIGLCNYSADSLLYIISFLIAPTEPFLSKNLLTIETSRHWYPSYYGFLAILNALSGNTLSAFVLLFKSSKSP